MDLLPGEHMTVKVDGYDSVSVLSGYRRSFRGALIISNFRLIVHDEDQNHILQVRRSEF
jgi:hypothetical protein